MKKYAKLLLIVTCLAMVFAMSVGVSATEYGVTYDNDTLVGTNAAIDVTVTIESADLGFTAIPVSLSSSSNNHTAIEALNSAAVSTAGYTFFYYDSTNQSYSPLSTTNEFFNRVKYNNVYYEGTGTGYSGWQFRINGGFPQETVSGDGYSYVQGSSVVTAKIKDGDVIAVYVDDPISQSSTTRFTRATVSPNYTLDDVTVNVTESHQYYGDNWAWTVEDFAAIGGLTVGIYSNSSLSASSCIDSTIASAGVAAFSDLDLDPGTYFVKVTGNMNGSPAVSSCLTTFTIEN